MANLETVEVQNGRRTAIKALGAFVAGIVFLGFTPPNSRRGGRSSEHLVYDGWVVDKTKQPLISFLHGYHPWTKEVILNNEILLEVTRATKALHNKARREKRILSIEDTIGYPTRYAYGLLKNLDPDLIAPGIDIKFEATHAGFAVLMAATDSDWTPQEYIHIGGELPESGSVLDDFQGKNGFINTTFPALLSAQKAEVDKENHIKHFCVNAGISFTRGLAKMRGWAEYRTIPIAPQLAAEIIKPFYDDGGYELEAVAVARALGYTHELWSTLDWSAIPYKQIPSKGIFDPNVGADLAVNILGAQFGARVLSRALERRRLTTLLKELRDPKFRLLTSGATLETDSPKHTRRSLLFLSR